MTCMWAKPRLEKRIYSRPNIADTRFALSTQCEVDDREAQVDVCQQDQSSLLSLVDKNRGSDCHRHLTWCPCDRICCSCFKYVLDWWVVCRQRLSRRPLIRYVHNAMMPDHDTDSDVLKQIAGGWLKKSSYYNAFYDCKLMLLLAQTSKSDHLLV